MAHSEDSSKKRGQVLTSRAFMGSQLPQQPIAHSDSGDPIFGFDISVSSQSPQQHSKNTKRKRHNPRAEVPSNKKRCPSEAEGTQICEDCARIDFSAVSRLDAAALQRDLRQGVFVANLGRRIGLGVESSCALCQLFSRVRITAQGLDDGAEYHLRAYSVFNTFNGMVLCQCPDRVALKDLPCLAVVSTSSTNRAIPDSHVLFLFCHSRLYDRMKIFTPRPTGSEVDFVRLKNMVDYCKRKHKHLCSDHQPMVSGLKLIDCRKEATNVSDLVMTSVIYHSPPYLALSYVWGDRKCDYSGSKAGDNDVIPTTVCDAMDVTRRLGHQYLWVDQYCINQHSESEREFEISRMDAIYHSAEITLIMAAGEDADAGLAGVRKESRVPQQSLTIGDVQLTSSMHVPKETIKSSRWYTRAWTFQEGILSRRRLVFTPFEVYLECRSMHWRESWEADLDDLHSHGRIRKFFCPGLFSGRSVNGSGTVARSRFESLKRFDCLVGEYSTKRFSRDYGQHDSLRAFQGIVNYFTRTNVPTYELWGVPFVYSASEPELAAKTFVLSMLWQHTTTALSYQGGPVRRPAFPSWSSAGWEGGVRFPDRSSTITSSCQVKIWNLLLESSHGDGEIANFSSSEFVAKLKRPSFHKATSLNFTAYKLLRKELASSVRPTSRSCWNPPSVILGASGFTAIVYLSGGNLNHKSFRTLFRSGRYTFLLLTVEHHDEARRQQHYLRFLIVEMVGESNNRVDTSGTPDNRPVQEGRITTQRVGTMLVKVDLKTFKEKFTFQACEIGLC